MDTDRIDSLDDFAAVRAVEALAGMFPDLPQTAAEGELVGHLRDAAETDASAPLDAQDPASVARELLHAFAADEDFAPAVEAVIESSSDSQLATKPILAMGVAATLIIVAATTEVSIEAGPVRIHKTTASPELVSNVGRVLQPHVSGAGRTRLPDHRVKP